MSVSVGIGVQEVGEGLLDDIAGIAEGCGYAVSAGLPSFEEDVQTGIQRLVDLKGWADVFCVSTPARCSSKLAYGIHEELSSFRITGVRPTFFTFCESLARCAEAHGLQRVGIFFATEWYADDRIRTSYGSVERLVTTLSLPSHWVVLTLNPARGWMEDWDELPFFYELECNPTQPDTASQALGPLDEQS